MLIKQQGFKLLLPTALPALLVLNSAEIFLVDQFRQLYKKTWLSINNPNQDTKNSDDTIDYKSIEIIKTEDWEQVSAELGNFSLFSTITVLDLVYDKKNFDQPAKNFLRQYLQRGDPHCLVQLYCPQLTAANLKFLADDPKAAVCTVKIPDRSVLEHWITESLRATYANIAPNTARLITQMTQGNLLACSQVVQKLILSKQESNALNEKDVLAQLENQCVYQLYELTEACLQGDAAKALVILRYALETNELILVLWIITQEIRLLLQLHDFHGSTNQHWQNGLKQLKIWPSRSALYLTAIKRFHQPNTLKQLLAWCCELEQALKTTQTHSLSDRIESLVVSLCLGRTLNEAQA